jgi:molecular chaperone GrpE
MTDKHADRGQPDERRSQEARRGGESPPRDEPQEQTAPGVSRDEAGAVRGVETPHDAGRGTGATGDDALAQAESERDDYLEHLQRLQAEFDNYRKRVRRDQEQLRLHAAETVVESLLPVVDNMRRALEAVREHGEEQLSAGVGLVYDQLLHTLAGHGLTEVVVEDGMAFDPEVHEAVMTQPSDDHDEGAVVQVMERGYLLHGRLLRPAKVIVAR